MNSWAVTDKGIVRKQNQDTYYSYCDASKGFGFFVVCDGMGGAKAGNIASAHAVETFTEAFRKKYDIDKSPDKIEDYLREAARDANDRVYAESSSTEEYRGMGTTIVAAVISDDRAFVLNIGDSRAYHISPKYGIKQITRDHSVVEDLIERGDITRAQSHNHPNKNLITRAIGTVPRIEADVFYPQLDEGDYLLLCSDGLSNIVSEPELIYELMHAKELEEAGQQLLKLGFSRGAPDNITVVLFKK